MTQFWRKAVLMWVLLLLLSLIFAPYTAHAAQLSEAGCEQLARLVLASAETRDVGGDREKYLAAVLLKNAGAPVDVLEVIRAEVLRVWSSSAAPQDLYTLTLRRCFAARGDLGAGA